MPRIRTLKPEHRQHRKVGALSDRQYRLWVGMICEADDEGRLVADAEQLRLLIFGFHPEVTASDVDSALAHLGSRRLVRVYYAERQRYASFPDWLIHQRINRPTPSKLPPPKARGKNSVSAHGHGELSDGSVSTHAGSEGIGRERIKDRKGREGSGEGNPRRSHDADPAPGPPDDDADVVLARALHLSVAEVRRRRAEAQARAPQPDGAPAW